MRYLILLVFIPFFSSLVAQSNDSLKIIKAFENINAKYEKLTNYSLSSNYIVYRDKIGGTVLDQSKSTYKQYKSGVNYRVFNGTISINSGDKSLIIDEVSKRMILGKAIKSDNFQGSIPTSESLKMATSYSYKNNTISMTFGTLSPYRKVVIQHDANFYIKSIIIEPTQKISIEVENKNLFVNTVVEIKFEGIKKSGVRESDCKISKFIKKNEQGYTPVEAYKNYQLINQIQ